MGGTWCLLVPLVFMSIYDSEQRSTPSSPTYKAGVVEFHPHRIDNDVRGTLNGNAAKYTDFIQEAGTKEVDIIVFPEDALTTLRLPQREKLDPWTTLIPAPSDNYVPCDNDSIPVSETLKTISCAAKNSTVYVVINIAEKYPCNGNECANDKVLYYNTNVVFDRKGKVIARYRKANLFVEPQFNVTTTPEYVTFDTDFGVTFGTFICFDILFKEPALHLTRNLGVRDIVYSTAWFSETPFLTAVQTQAGWAYAEDVNLLAAGYNQPDNKNAGSGIYLGRQGIEKAIMPLTNHQELLIVDVPKKEKIIHVKDNHDYDQDRHHHEPEKHKIVHDELRRKRFLEPEKVHEELRMKCDMEPEELHDELRRKRSSDHLSLFYDNLSIFQTKIIADNGLTKENLCQNNFCCDFTVNVSSLDPNTSYRLAVFHGIRTYAHTIKAGTSACGVVQCANVSVASCGHVKNSETTFNFIDITATFEDDKNILVMPSSLNSMFFPLVDWTYDEHKHKHESHDHSHVHINYRLERATRDLVAFGLYGRDFSNDGKDQIDFSNSAITLEIRYYAIFCIILTLL